MHLVECPNNNQSQRQVQDSTLGLVPIANSCSQLKQFPSSVRKSAQPLSHSASRPESLADLSIILSRPDICQTPKPAWRQHFRSLKLSSHVKVVLLGFANSTLAGTSGKANPDVCLPNAFFSMYGMSIIRYLKNHRQAPPSLYDMRWLERHSYVDPSRVQESRLSMSPPRLCKTL
jgi:hypothetical protein